MGHEIDFNYEDISSATAEGPFDSSLHDLNKEGFELISIAENSILRILAGILPENNYQFGNLLVLSEKFPVSSKFGNFVSESVLYYPKKGNCYLIKNSPILEFPEEATLAHRDQKEFYIGEEKAEELIKNSVICPIEDTNFELKNIENNDLFNFIFDNRNDLTKYKEFLKCIGLNRIDFWIDDPKRFNKLNSKPFLRQVYYCGLEHESRIMATRAYLDKEENWSYYNAYGDPDRRRYGPVRGIKGSILEKNLETKVEIKEYPNQQDLWFPIEKIEQVGR